MSNNDKNLNTENIINFSLDEIMSDRFGRYAKYIIQERALPDVRDGLKPVQRRVLYAMNDINLTWDKAYKKSARVVGDVIGKYHPHGDSSVYDALVRMSQPWKLNMPLVDMHGNNGSIDGDSAAAMRYTEVKLTKISGLLLSDLEKNTVQFAPNFDDSEKEPTVLPGYFPNILINGSSGIAAGYATNMPPHNMVEIVDAVIALIKKPTLKLSDIMKIVKGPDFPTGGVIMGQEGLEQAFETGKGKVVIQSKYHREENNLIIDEIPYEIVKQDLVKKIGEVADDNPSLGIKEVRDETDRTGLRIFIEIAADADFDRARKYLFKHTSLQVAFNYNNVVIVDKQPKQLGIKSILEAYVVHYKNIFKKKTKFDLDKAEKRLEIINGLIKAISILDEVIAIIRNSKNRSDSIKNLMEKYEFTEVQAGAIVDLRLYRLTSTDIVKLEEELNELTNLAAKLNLLLSDQSAFDNEIIKRLKHTRDTFGIPRRSEFVCDIENIEVEIEKTIFEKDYNIWVSQDGYLKIVDESIVAKNSMEDFKRKPNDILIASSIVSTLDTVILVSTAGTYYSIPVHKIQPSKWKDIGVHINSLATMSGNEKILAAFFLKTFKDSKQEILLASKNGMIKRTTIEDLETKMTSKAFRIMKLDSSDELVSASLVTSKSKYAVIVSKAGYSVKYNINEIPSAGQNAKGVKSYGGKDDEVISGKVIDDEDILICTNRGNVKKIKKDLIPLMSRPKRGLRLYPMNKKKDEFVVSSFTVSDNEKLILLNEKDDALSFDIKEFKFLNLEDINQDLDVGEVVSTCVEKEYKVIQNDIPPKPKSE